MVNHGHSIFSEQALFLWFLDLFSHFVQSDTPPIGPFFLICIVKLQVALLFVTFEMLLQVGKVDRLLLFVPLGFRFGGVEPAFCLRDKVVDVSVIKNLNLFMNSVFLLLLLCV